MITSLRFAQLASRRASLLGRDWPRIRPTSICGIEATSQRNLYWQHHILDPEGPTFDIHRCAGA